MYILFSLYQQKPSLFFRICELFLRHYTTSQHLGHKEIIIMLILDWELYRK